MTVIVRDNGFAADDWDDGRAALELPPEADPDTLADRLDGIARIRVAFPGFSDGRGFTLARRLRDLGFTGQLRAAGHVIADQYAMARRAGFDEVEIDDDLAARQPWPQWQARADWRAHDYQSRLRG